MGVENEVFLFHRRPGKMENILIIEKIKIFQRKILLFLNYSRTFIFILIFGFLLICPIPNDKLI